MSAFSGQARLMSATSAHFSCNSNRTGLVRKPNRILRVPCFTRCLASRLNLRLPVPFCSLTARNFRFNAFRIAALWNRKQSFDCAIIFFSDTFIIQKYLNPNGSPCNYNYNRTHTNLCIKGKYQQKIKINKKLNRKSNWKQTFSNYRNLKQQYLETILFKTFYNSKCADWKMELSRAFDFIVTTPSVTSQFLLVQIVIRLFCNLVKTFKTRNIRLRLHMYVCPKPWRKYTRRRIYILFTTKNVSSEWADSR